MEHFTVRAILAIECFASSLRRSELLHLDLARCQLTTEQIVEPAEPALHARLQHCGRMRPEAQPPEEVATLGEHAVVVRILRYERRQDVGPLRALSFATVNVRELQPVSD